MTERNRLTNGRFMHDLNNWTASDAVYSAGDGDEHYGVAVLSTGGGTLSQTFSVPHFRLYTLHIAVKAVGSDLSTDQVTVAITDGDGNTVISDDLSGTADTWTDNTMDLGLAPGTTYTLRLTNVSAAGDVRLDDVWLWWLPITRASIAARVAAKLGRLATDRSLSATASGSLTEGDYTYAIDAALRSLGALDPDTALPDVRYLDFGQVNSVLDAAEREMLEKLRRDYAVEVDIGVGSRRESLSQIGRALDGLIGTGGAGGGQAGQVTVRKLRREADDYEF